MLICILTKNVITSCSVTMMLFLHLEVKPLMTLTTVLYVSCALISGHLAMMLMELTKRREASFLVFFFSSRRRHTRCSRDWSSDVCSSDLIFFVDGQHQSAVGFPVGGGKVGPGREAAKRWEPPGKPPGALQMHLAKSIW